MSVGNKADALRLLHEAITSKRHGRGGGPQWQQAYEPLMMLYLELCVDLKENRGAKDGLHQYRNMSQQHVRGVCVGWGVGVGLWVED